MSASGHLVTFRPLSSDGFAQYWGIVTLGAGLLLPVVADQSLAPILHSTSPLWALLCFTLLASRRSTAFFSGPAAFPVPTLRRSLLFVAAHGLLVFTALKLTSALTRHAGAITPGGWILAFAKLSVLVPILVLYPLAQWRTLRSIYAPEIVASLVVLFTFFPARAIEALWPWYGQILGRTVYAISSLFVPSLHYLRSLYPSVTGPDLDVQILLSCSGINGIELFDCLFGFVVLCDWNRLNKGRTLLGYWFGLSAIIAGNALRIVSFVVAGNRGLASLVTRFHLPAGSIFFSVVFLIYLAVAYPRMLRSRKESQSLPQSAGAASSISV